MSTAEGWKRNYKGLLEAVGWLGRSSWVVAISVAIGTTAGLLGGCATDTPVARNRILVGVVAYGDGAVSLDRLENFKDYLALQTRSVVEIEPAFNEVKALQQIRSRRWSLVFAPPGLAATAISTEQYLPLFPLQGSSNTVRSTIVVREDSSVQELADLQGEAIALGQPGSATGYYLPLYDLFGLTLSKVQVSATPKGTLAAVASGEVMAGALAKDEYELYKDEFGETRFRVVHTGRRLPAGAVLLGPSVDRNLQKYISEAMNEATPNLASEAGYIPNVNPPNYEFFIEIVEKVSPYESRIYERPASLYPEIPITPSRPNDVSSDSVDIGEN